MPKKNIFFLLILCLFLSGCPKIDSPKDYFSEQATDSWEKYEIHTHNFKSSPFRILMSLHLSSINESYRVNAVMWGNSTTNLRLDVMTGIGTSIAKVAQTEDDFLAYEPRNNLAYFHYGKRKPLLKLKIPIPFGLTELAALLNGQYSKIFGSEYISKNNVNGRISYVLAKKDIGGTLQLNADGLPIVWKNTDNDWSMFITYSNVATLASKNLEGDANNNSSAQSNLITLLPKKIEIIGPDSKKTVLFVKKNKQLTKAFAANNLKLILPHDAVLKPLK